jgi:hypothetical protein
VSDNLAIPHTTEVVDISAADHTFTLRVDSIYCGGAGDLIVRVRGDSTDRTYKVTAGQVVYGDFSIVRRTNTTASSLIGQKSRNF